MSRYPTRKSPRQLLREIRKVKRDLVAARAERKACGFFEKLRIWNGNKEVARIEARLAKLQEKARGQRKLGDAG